MGIRVRTIAISATLAACALRSREPGEAPPSAPSVVEATLARYHTVLGSLSAPDSSAAPRATTVTLPERARGAVSLEDTRSHTAIRFALEGAEDSALVTDDDLSLAAGAVGAQADLLYRLGPNGVEDYLLYPARPKEERVRYRVDLSSAAALRLVAGTLEFLDAQGAPRLRMAPPYVRDASGARHDIDVAVTGCAVDRDPRPPWRRPITAPGADACAVELSWADRGVVYPAAVDPAWTTTKGVMVEAHPFPAVAVLSTGIVLAAGGVTSAPLYTAELFDPSTETWAATGKMATNPWYPWMTALPGGLAVLAGPGAVSVYDVATGSWTSPTLAATDAASPIALADGRALVVGETACQIYDPATRALTKTGSLSVQRRAACVERLPDGKVIAVAGYSSSETHRSTELFDPSAGTWSAGPPLAIARDLQTCTRLTDGRVLVAGGEYGDSVTRAEIYDPIANSWSFAGNFAVPRSNHAASAMPDGKALVTGGDYGITVASTELYDPASNAWLLSGDMTVTRAYHASVTLPSGGVLVVGGYGGPSLSDLASSEIFRPLGPGAPCTENGACTSEHCVDGVCCDEGCNAACYACSAAKKGRGADGVCEPVAAGPDPAQRCRALSPATCSTDGLCNGFGACALHPEGTVCVPLACTGATLSESTCDGEGACVPKTTSCGAFSCATRTSCAAGSCAGDTDCAPAFACESGACVPRKPSCDGDHTLVAADGALTDCAPFKCAGSACIARCNSATECAGDHVCNRNGACVLPQDAARAETEALLAGCSVGRSSDDGGVLALTTLAAWRRRRRGGAR